MYTIGEFSIIVKLNKKTIRYYDEIGLFQPAYIDPNNQYRYYKREQINDLNRIIKLKETGISLEQIKNITTDSEDVSIKDIYNKRLSEIELEIEKLKKQQDNIKTLLSTSHAERNVNKEFDISKGYYIVKGLIVYQKAKKQEDIHDIINNFYNYVGNKVTLSSGHFFKRSLDDNADGISEIFAYTTNVSEELDIKTQTKELCLRTLCDSIENRDLAYASIFDYAKNNNIVIGSIYERYKINAGKMQIEIMFEIV